MASMETAAGETGVVYNLVGATTTGGHQSLADGHLSPCVNTVLFILCLSLSLPSISPPASVNHPSAADSQGPRSPLATGGLARRYRGLLIDPSRLIGQTAGDRNRSPLAAARRSGRSDRKCHGL
ncbi:hypothetical protein WMY93_014688 [Mugilogobius chulae]|uniref:Uncharacterized protein n=1 Tax=Mugilogobius chulae TaxID=88201 RepID=A0AAW0NW72_9GOBI